jgi:hypothetical protein
MEIMTALLAAKPNVLIKILAGNHDLYFKNTTEVASINVFKNFDPRIEVLNHIKGYNFNGYKVMVVPWLVDESRSSKGFWKIVNDYKDTGKKTVNLCLGHFEINGFEIVNGVFEEKGVNQADFEAFDQTFSGHFHLRRSHGNIQYLGCPYEITWNDWADEKGITIWDTETEKMEFIPTVKCAKHIIIKWSDIVKNETVIDKTKNGFVKLVIDVIPDIEQKIRILDKLDAYGLKKLETLDETSHEINTDNTEGSIVDYALDPQNFIKDFLDQIPMPEDLTKEEVVKRTAVIYNKSLVK